MWALAGAGVLLLFAVDLRTSSGLKCGVQAVDLKSMETVSESEFFTRIISWRNSTVDGHLWQVSLKLCEHHFCRGSLIQGDLAVTAAHCLVRLNEKQIKSLTVIAGEYNLFQKDKQEQTIPVSKIVIHPEYNRLGYMSSDIALPHLKHKVKFDIENQVGCDDDYVSLQSSNGVLVKTNKAKVTFVSDAENSGNGFEFTFRAVQKNSEAGSCRGSVTEFVEEGTIHSASYPDLYPRNLAFEDFNTEFNQNCIYDAAVIYSDPEEEHELVIPYIVDISTSKESNKDFLNKIGSTSPPQNHPVSSEKTIPYEIYYSTNALEKDRKNNPLFWSVVAGDHDRTLKESTDQVRRAKHIVMHEDFDRLSFDLYIALVQLSSLLAFSSAVRPMCLPHSTEPLFPSEICAVTGWGSVSEDSGLANRFQQSMLEREMCEHTYYFAHSGGITEKMICTGFTATGGKNFCQGDSAGPLVYRHEKDPFVLYGIINWGAGCAQSRKPVGFARVSVFLDWIQSKLKDTSSASLQINNESKTLTKKQLSPLTASTDNASELGCYSEVELEESPKAFFQLQDIH